MRSRRWIFRGSIWESLCCMAPASSLCAARLEALSLCRRRGAPPPRPTAPRSVQGLTTCLYPLSVIKTRQMALEGAPPGLWVRRGAPLGGAQRHLDVAALRRAHARRPRAPAGRCAGCPAGGCRGRRTGAVPGVHHGRGRRHTRARGAPLRRLRAPRERLAPRRKAPAAAATAAGPEQPACWRPPCAGAGRARAGAALRPGRRRGAACEAGSAGPGGRDSIG